MSENAPAGTGTENAPAGSETQQGKTFTQAELDQIISDRLHQQARTKFGDYDELKTKAGNAQTLEQRLASVEGELTTTKASQLRTAIAAEYGISTKRGLKGEPSVADLLLTGTDEATLTAQAKALAGAEADRKKNGNIAPKEGESKNSGNGSTDLREFSRGLFGNSD